MSITRDRPTAPAQMTRSASPHSCGSMVLALWSSSSTPGSTLPGRGMAAARPPSPGQWRLRPHQAGTLAATPFRHLLVSPAPGRRRDEPAPEARQDREPRCRRSGRVAGVTNPTETRSPVRTYSCAARLQIGGASPPPGSLRGRPLLPAPILVLTARQRPRNCTAARVWGAVPTTPNPPHSRRGSG